jgi:hypothetical protein
LSPEETARLYAELFGIVRNGEVLHEGLAQITCTPKWDDARAAAIGVQQWIDVFSLALVLDRALPGLPKPEAGADPGGFMWLTWRTKSAEFALQIHPGLLVRFMYQWTVTRFGVPNDHRSATLTGVAESLKTTFGYSTTERASHAAA